MESKTTHVKAGKVEWENRKWNAVTIYPTLKGIEVESCSINEILCKRNSIASLVKRNMINPTSHFRIDNVVSPTAS